MSTRSVTPEYSVHRVLYVRHSWPVRVMHWINAIALTLLLMSGLQIFNAHPALYWGQSSYSGRPALLQMGAEPAADGSLRGVTEIFGRKLDTTGFLGLSRGMDGELVERGFPSWATLPSNQWLAMARRWHFFFAWILVINGVLYVAYSFYSGHFSADLLPTRRDWRSVGSSILDHLRFRHPRGEAARRYNVLQKLAYVVVMFALLPFMVLMGLAMSPAMDTVLPGWVNVFGGRQGARTLHFFAAMAIVSFAFIHLFEVAITGAWNNIRSMITGRFAIEVDEGAPVRKPSVGREHEH